MRLLYAGVKVCIKESSWKEAFPNIPYDKNPRAITNAPCRSIEHKDFYLLNDWHHRWWHADDLDEVQD